MDEKQENIERFRKANSEEVLKKVNEFRDSITSAVEYEKSEASVIYEFMAEEGKKLFKTESSGFGVNFCGDSVSPFGSDRSSINRHGQDGSIKRKIAACREAYENEGIIGNIIDIMVDFALEGVDILHPSESVNNFFQRWKSTVKIDSLLEEIFKAYFRDSNVPILSFKGIVTQEEEKRLKKVFGNEIRTTGNELLVRPTVELKEIPVKYSVLDVLRLDKDSSNILGIDSFSYFLDSADREIIDKGTNGDSEAVVKKLEQIHGPEITEAIRTKGKMPLDIDRISMIYYKKDGFKKWAIPMLWRVIPDLKYKRLLRQMDISAAEGVTNALTIIKLGDAQADFPATSSQYERLATMMKNPSKSKVIIWDNMIDIVSDYPPIGDILGEEKYAEVNKAIRSGLGISEVLVNGSSEGNFANAFLSVKTLLKRLEGAREVILFWLKEQIMIITRNMGFRKAPHVRLRSMSLNDEDAEKKIILELLDRNIISTQTVLEKFGENIEIEVHRMIKEDKIRKDLEEIAPFTLLKTGKFGPQHSAGIVGISNIVDEKINEKETKSIPSAQEQNGKDGGRPPGVKKKKKSQQVPNKPQGQKVAASVEINKEDYDKACLRFDKAYNMISDAILKENKNKILDQKEKTEAYNVIISAICYITDARKLTYKSMMNILSGEFDKSVSGPKLDSCVRGVVSQKVKEFKKRNKGKSPSKGKMKEITSSAFAICNASLKGNK